jgi:hypothetical protein
VTRATNAQRLAGTRGRLQQGTQIGDDAIVIVIANDRMTSDRDRVETTGIAENDRWRSSCSTEAPKRRPAREQSSPRNRSHADFPPGRTACRTLLADTVTAPSHTRNFLSFVTKLKAKS